MVTEIFSRINPIDALLVCVVLRILYIAIKRGPLVEFFKFLAAFSAAFIVLHYYPRLAQVFYKAVAISRANNDILAFALLWLGVTIVFKLIREGCLLLQGKKEGAAPTQQWLSFILGALRGILVCGLMSVVFLFSENKPFVKNVAHSKSVPVLVKLTGHIYQGTYDSLVKRFFPDEEFNDRVLSLTDQDSLE